MAARRPTRKGNSSDAPGSGMRFERADLGGLAHAQESAARGARDPSRLPPARGGSGSCPCCFDRTPGRIPQRSECPKLGYRRDRGGDEVPQTGFFGTAAPWTADVTLLLELALGVGLLAGALLARSGRHRVHAACQSVIVLLNLAVIVATMLPSFDRQVLPKLPGSIGRPYYALAAMHAALGESLNSGVCTSCWQPEQPCFPKNSASGAIN